MYKYCIFIILLLLTVAVQAQTRRTPVSPSLGTLAAGDIVSGISVGEWVQGKPEAGNAFDGKTVILEFWATWCGPCVKAIPHLNDLADKFANDDVVFAAVSNERATTVTEFLKKHTMKYSVFVDTEKSATYNAFGVRVIPRSFVIDPDRVILWTGHPEKLTADLLTSLLGLE